MQRIIVADDVELNREILRSMLEDDYIVEVAKDGEQAIIGSCGNIIGKRL